MRRFLAAVLLLSSACAGKQDPAPAPAAPAPAPVSAGAEAAPPASEPGSGVERIFLLANGDRGPSFGPKTAKVMLDVCSDFECPFCARLVPTLHEIEENYGELVRVHWRNCPLPMHPSAMPAAEASLEVFTQGGDKAFWAYHDVLFAHQNTLDTESLVRLAGGLSGIDATKVRAALTDHRHVPAVQADLRAVVDSGAASGGFGTPATFVNGRLISGAQPYEVFEQAVERALQESPEAYAQALAKSNEAYPMVTLRHILVQYQGARGAEPKVTRSKDQARALASDLHQKLVIQAAPFGKLAEEQSDDDTPSEGGLLGRFTRGELLPEIDRVVFALAPGELSPVVETPFGFHVFLRDN
jgi:protein-disulfide isomerase